METSFFYYGNKHPEPQKAYATSFFTLFSGSLIFSSLLFLFSDSISELLEFKGYETYFYYLIAIVALDTIAVIPFAKLRFDNKPRKFATIKIANILTNIFFNLFFLLLCPFILKQEGLKAIHPFITSIYDPGIGVGYVFISNLLASAFTLLLLYKEISDFSIWKVNRKLWMQMVAYAAPLILVGTAGMINETIDRILLKFLLPYSLTENLANIGVYNACYKLSIFMTVAVQAFRYAAEPFFFSQAKNTDAKEIYSRVLKYFTFFGAFIFLTVNLYLEIIKYFIGPAYWGGLGVVPILLMANLFLGIFYNLSIWYKIKEKNNIGALIAIGGAIVTISLNFIWIPVFGYYGSAWATFFCYFSMAIASYIIGRNYYPVPYDLKKIVLYIGTALALYYIGTLIDHNIKTSLGILELILKTILLAGYLYMFLKIEKPKNILNLSSYFK